MWGLFALLTVAAAEMPLPDYRAELGERAAADVSALSEAGRYAEAVQVGERFAERVEPLPPVLYEIGLACYRWGQLDRALSWYDRAIEGDPDNAAARYDRGEILLSRGDLDAAAEDFAAAARADPTHWAVHFRLAHLAALRGDADAFEAHLTDALRHGFDFRTIAQDPDWKRWSRDPALGPVLARFITVYSDEAILEQLRAE